MFGINLTVSDLNVVNFVGPPAGQLVFAGRRDTLPIGSGTKVLISSISAVI